MAHTFDPYYKWLAIPPKDQPPNHYRLLGVELFEPDLDVIDSAADQRMAHVRSFQTGPNSAASQKLLNELAAARVCLLNPDQKARYDATLRAKQAEVRPAPPVETQEPLPLVTPSLITPSLITPSRASPQITPRRDALPRWLVPVGVAALLVPLAALLLLLRGGAKPPPTVKAPRPEAKKNLSESSSVTRSAGQSGAKDGAASRPTKALTRPRDRSPAGSQEGDAPLVVVVAPDVELRFVPIPASADGRVRPFYLGQTEVTQAQWSALMSDRHNASKLPQVAVKHSEARTFCDRLSALPAAGRRRFRLPTREEFIQAYGDLSAYGLEQVWCQENAPPQPPSVATRQADARGAFDLLGNVWEWAADGRFYGMSASDSLQRRFLAYSSITLPPDYAGATIDYSAGNLGLRVATDDDRPLPAPPAPTETETAAAEPPEPRPAVLARLFAEPLTPPDVPGVAADRVLIWNQHHGAANDAGTREVALSLFAAGQQVWQVPVVNLIAAANQETFVDVRLPEPRFDRLRVEVTKFVARHGGLAEIEVFRGTTNLARDCPTATAASVEPRFPPAAVTDGIISQTRTEPEGYWLLPAESAGWIDVDLSFAAPRRCRGVPADRVVVRNQHNGVSGDRGTSAFNVALVANGAEIWRRDAIALAWSADDDGEAAVNLPPLRFDRLRVEVTRWQGLGGGLSEVEVWQGDRNIALACPVAASSYHLQMHRAANLTDGIAHSREPGGYWLLPDNTRGWAEIDLSPNDPTLGEANGRLGAYRTLVEDNWPLGLPWLARSPDVELRRLALGDLSANGAGALALSALGDGWWEVAQLVGGQPRERLLARALRRYAQALSNVPAEEQNRLRRRRDEVLPSLVERHYLYFIEESERRLFAGDEYGLRSRPVVVGGVPSPNGLSLHPPASGESWARFVLPGGCRRFHGAVGINDAARRPASPVTFSISGDGRALWTSQPHQAPGESEPFDLNISGVKSLRITAAAAGANDGCHAVWIEPRLEE